MSDDDDNAPADQGEDSEVAPASEEAYPALELTQLTESDRGAHDGWAPFGDE